MSLHEEVAAAIASEIEALGSAIALSPTSVALAVQRRFTTDAVEPHLLYTSLEHIKHMARSVLAKRFDADGDESVAHQGELFSGQLQQHYPTPRVGRAEPIYKKREALSRDEIEWNVAQLRKSASARLAHADALQAWADSFAAAA